MSVYYFKRGRVSELMFTLLKFIWASSMQPIYFKRIELCQIQSVLGDIPLSKGIQLSFLYN